MGARVRALQWLGLVTMTVSAFWPTYHFRTYPIPGLETPPAAVMPGAQRAITGAERFYVLGTREVPAQEFGAAVVEAARGPDRLGPAWDRRRWYPYALLPLWVLALALVSGRGGAPGAVRRRLVGLCLWGLTFALALFEALYLRTEYLPFAPGFLGRVEGFLAWLFVLGILLYRRPPDRRVGAVEATLAAQALLSFVHALTLPSTMARGWWGTFETGAVLATVWTNFPPAFWLGCSGMLLVALPVYLRRTPAGLDLP